MIQEFFERYWKYFLALLISWAVIGTVLAYYFYNENNVERKIEKLNYLNKIKYLKESYNHYKEMSSIELHTKWLILFDNVYYKSGGNSNFNNYDCLSSSWKFWKSCGANIILEEIPWMVERLKYSSFRVISVDKIKRGDIIVFKPIGYGKNITWHVGVIEKAFQNKVFYMDVNGTVGTRGFNIIPFNDSKIYGIYSMTFAFWVGDLYKNTDKSL